MERHIMPIMRNGTANINTQLYFFEKHLIAGLDSHLFVQIDAPGTAIQISLSMVNLLIS